MMWCGGERGEGERRGGGQSGIADLEREGCGCAQQIAYTRSKW